jgi:hypothetical protein
MQSNTICSSRQFFILFNEMMKREYPEEDIQGAYIQALLFIRECLRRKINSMIYENNRFVCNKCKEELENINYVVGGKMEGFA